MAGGGKNETYYDILNLPKNCSEKDIRNAFINLSKKYHPDVRNATKMDEKSSSQFLKISEAYQTLSKPHLRREYDQKIEGYRYIHEYENVDSTTPPIFRPWDIRPDYNPNINSENFYGVKGINRASNSKVAAFLLVVSLLSGIVGIASAKRSHRITSARMNENSLRNIELHKQLCDEVQKLSQEERIRRVTGRLYSGKEIDKGKKATITRHKIHERK